MGYNDKKSNCQFLQSKTKEKRFFITNLADRVSFSKLTEDVYKTIIKYEYYINRLVSSLFKNGSLIQETSQDLKCSGFRKTCTWYHVWFAEDSQTRNASNSSNPLHI